VKFSFQDVDGSTGTPDGTPDQYRVKTGASITAGWVEPGLITSDGTDTGTKRSVTKGQLLALVMEWDSTKTGEIDPHGIMNYSTSGSQGGGLPYGMTHNGTSWSKANSGHYPSFALKYDDGTYASIAPLGLPISAGVSSRNFASNSTPDERGLYFSFPTGVKIDGGWIHLDLNASSPVDMVLYDTDGTTVLASMTLDPDVVVTNDPQFRRFLFSSEITLVAGAFYRLVMKPTSTTSSVMYEISVTSAAVMDAMPGGANFHLTTRTDAGAWTQTATSRPWMGVRVVAISVGYSAPVAGGAGRLVGGGFA
jgi:hypothetical protein